MNLSNECHELHMGEDSVGCHWRLHLFDALQEAWDWCGGVQTIILTVLRRTVVPDVQSFEHEFQETSLGETVDVSDVWAPGEYVTDPDTRSPSPSTRTKEG